MTQLCKEGSPGGQQADLKGKCIFPPLQYPGPIPEVCCLLAESPGWFPLQDARLSEAACPAINRGAAEVLQIALVTSPLVQAPRVPCHALLSSETGSCWVSELSTPHICTTHYIYPTTETRACGATFSVQVGKEERLSSCHELKERNKARIPNPSTVLSLFLYLQLLILKLSQKIKLNFF
jgi:hypothetical protein